MPFPQTIRSGMVSQWSTPKARPVRPNPVSTSSAISSTPYSSQIARKRGKYSSGGVAAPSELPTIGSAMKAATLSGPSRKIARSSSSAQSMPHAG
ncbi:MAG: hypothetical protein OXG37_03225 [Actinomycetia bacterium]|nr:hypothetical protein [Actinomycetes bacterium]